MTESNSGRVRAAAPDVRWTVRDTPIGPLLLATTDSGLVNVIFRAGDAVVPAAVRRLAGRLRATPERHDPVATCPADSGRRPAERHLSRAAEQLDAYFGGDLRDFTVPLDWSLSGGFNHRVLLELAAGVRYGSVVGYQTLADRVGEPGAARAVGVAMGSNPLPVVVACHRVIENDGGIGGFGGGLDIKRRLLALEGVLPEPLF